MVSMNWPPLKAWTSKYSINGYRHFVALDYGGNRLDKWVVLVAVLDGSFAVKVLWSKLVDQSQWLCGWDESNHSGSSEMIIGSIEIIKKFNLSSDSGLTVPITKQMIRPWFD